jgi:thymidylate synthase
MAKFDQEFKSLLAQILSDGRDYTNTRRGVTRLEIPSYNYVHKMEDGFPLLTSKHVHFKSVVTELFWFLRGDTDINYLHEHGCHIWDKDAERFNEGGSIGRGYGFMWRFSHNFDQIANLINGMKSDLNGSRNLVQAFTAEHHLPYTTALPPCHTVFQIIAVRGGFRLQFHMRAWDVFLGAPFNWASYALLGLLLERETGHKFVEIEVMASCIHLYDNQIEAARELIKEPEFHPPTVVIDNVPMGLSDLEVCRTLVPEMVKLNGYEHGKRFKVEML